MKKNFLLFIAMISMIVIFSACSSSGDNGESSNESSSGEETTENGTEETGSSGETIEIIANAIYPESNHVTQGMIEFSEKVEEATGGKVKIVVNSDGALGYEGPELLKAVRDNSVTISDVLTSNVVGDEPLFGISTLPFISQNFDEGKVFIDVARPYYEQVAEEKWNQKVLFGVSWPYAGFWTQDPVETIDDLKGKKMRTYDENGALVVQAAGGVPSPLPFSEVYSGLQTGVIDSVLTSSPTAVDAKFWEVLDYYVPTKVTAAYSIITMNLDEFNKLDQETQDIMMEIGKEMDEIMWQRNLELDEEMEATVVENGIEILEPSQEFMDDWAAIGKEIADEWLQNAPAEAQEIIDQYNAEVGR